MNNKPINIGLPNIGIVGTKSVEHRKNGDVIETRTGSFTAKYIASFFLIVEDNLAKQVIDTICSGLPNLPRKYIFSGAWGNQAACLFGFLMYSQQLKSTNIPQFSVLAIDDGDIPQSAREKRIGKILKGNYFGAELKTAKENLDRLMLSFSLEYHDFNVKAGLPEYNHKKWFEEIKKEEIIKINAPSNIYDERQIESLLDLIEFSKNIELHDYHKYYDELTKFKPKNTLEMFHMTEIFILSSIKKYNTAKWDLYTRHIRDALIEIDETNRKNFIDAGIFFENRTLKSDA
ncbi:hypothetical protein [Pseudomonas syringae]|uniref:hypothetical protein n=1 Tax=Pseudomonas syringae TaxID=317 RepID=UPI0002A7B520|nr:hypothetical protein [Pseudomonas syringae]ELP97370.1 hypothetical protein A979_19245 [Pseudomonas syringae BRIP34876]ELP99238.1 hypothetical protein A987_20750 [Pseudomonas syringae BRIP34881]